VHSCSDAKSLANFLLDWSAELKGEPYETPVHDRNIVPRAIATQLEANEKLDLAKEVHKPIASQALQGKDSPASAIRDVSFKRYWWQLGLTERPPPFFAFGFLIALKSQLQVGMQPQI
jgi:hypothetical protein